MHSMMETAVDAVAEGYSLEEVTDAILGLDEAAAGLLRRGFGALAGGADNARYLANRAVGTYKDRRTSAGGSGVRQSLGAGASALRGAFGAMNTRQKLGMGAAAGVAGAGAYGAYRGVKAVGRRVFGRRPQPATGR